MIFRFTFEGVVYLVIRVGCLMEAVVRFQEKYALTKTQMPSVKIEELLPGETLEIAKARRTVTQWCRVFPEAEIIKHGDPDAQ